MIVLALLFSLGGGLSPTTAAPPRVSLETDSATVAPAFTKDVTPATAQAGKVVTFTLTLSIPNVSPGEAPVPGPERGTMPPDVPVEVPALPKGTEPIPREAERSVPSTKVRTLPAATAEITIRDPLPAGLKYVMRSATGGGVYDPKTGELTWTVAKLGAGERWTASFVARVTGAATETVVNVASAESTGWPASVEAKATLTVQPAGNEVIVTPGQGGELRSADGRLYVQVPPGAVTRDTRLRYVAGKRGTSHTSSMRSSWKASVGCPHLEQRATGSAFRTQISMR